VRALSARGEDPAQWIAAIGPAIGPCCYEVSEELAREFGSPQTRMLDLPALNAAQLRAAGIGEVELLRACTRCSLDERGTPLYASYRREGRGLQQRSVIVALTTPRAGRSSR
jgi:copper oxidase (laccase) domain-containing protein